MSRAVRLAIVLFTTFVVQATLIDSLPVFGARLDLWIIVTVAAGLGTGPDRGAAIGFLCGLLFDLTQNGPIGLGALIYSVAGYLVGSFARSVVGSSRWVSVLSGGATSFAAVTSYIALGILLGESQWLTVRMVPVVLVTTVGAALLTPPLVRIMAWTDGAPTGFGRSSGRSGPRGRSGRPGGRQRSSAASPSPRPRARDRA